jgi:ParB family chromosome partitioning protein
MSASPSSDAREKPGTRFFDLQDIPVAKIERGDNPRIHFPEEELERLAESVAKEGVLVPVVVYSDGKEGYRLIDGERRWITAQTLALETIPAVITDAPDKRQNLVRMFNIHQVREQWQDMPTAWALEDLLKETGSLTNRELADVTGLSVERTERLRHALELPREYQDHIDSGRIPLNFFWELKKNVIDPLASRRPSLAAEFEPQDLMASFVTKRLEQVITDTISLRKVGAIIRVAADEAVGGVEGPSPLDETLRMLIVDPAMTIEDAYEDTIELTIESDKLERKFGNLLTSLQRLLGKVHTGEDEGRLRELGRRLLARLSAILD